MANAFYKRESGFARYANPLGHHITSKNICLQGYFYAVIYELASYATHWSANEIASNFSSESMLSTKKSIPEMGMDFLAEKARFELALQFITELTP